MKFSDDIIALLNTRFPGKDIYTMNLKELKRFKEEIIELRQEYSLLELSMKTLGNAAYGASANRFFYFFNVNLAGDITGECRVLTKFMWDRLQKFFHEDIWERKDLWERFDFALDESKHDWFRTQPTSVYSDTDSIIGESMLTLKYNDVIQHISISELFDKLKNVMISKTTLSGHELLELEKYEVLNYVDGEVKFVPIKHLIRHKVSKPKFKIKTKSGKEIIVTGDHSCIVFRNGEKIEIKAKDINKDTDKILSVYDITNFVIEDIESIEQLDDFDNEYVFDIEVDDDTHTFVANDILVHNSVYTTYGTFLQCFTPEYQEKYDTDRKKVEWILKFNVEFLDKQNFDWLTEMYGPRHAKNIHNFELETISKACIYLKKKKYLKALSFSKGKFFDTPKMSGTGIEIVKSTTPKLCRKILTELTQDLMFNAGKMSHDEYIFYFRDLMENYKKQFYAAPIEDISQSVGIGAYKKYIIDDKDQFITEKGCPVSVKAIGLYNHLAHKNGQDNLYVISGKIKYYNIRLSPKTTSFFGFPAGELPEWAPKMDKKLQWEKTIVEPINRFLEVMDFPKMNAENTLQMTLF